MTGGWEKKGLEGGKLREEILLESGRAIIRKIGETGALLLD